MKHQGPKKLISYSCFDCEHVVSERYVCQGDSGRDVYCTHSAVAADGPRSVGDSTWSTPGWCPYMKEQWTLHLTDDELQSLVCVLGGFRTCPATSELSEEDQVRWEKMVGPLHEKAVALWHQRCEKNR